MAAPSNPQHGTHALLADTGRQVASLAPCQAMSQADHAMVVLQNYRCRCCFGGGAHLPASQEGAISQ